MGKPVILTVSLYFSAVGTMSATGGSLSMTNDTLPAGLTLYTKVNDVNQFLISGFVAPYNRLPDFSSIYIYHDSANTPPNFYKLDTSNAPSMYTLMFPLNNNPIGMGYSGGSLYYGTLDNTSLKFTTKDIEAATNNGNVPNMKIYLYYFLT
jgi:hypothetical protein